MCWQVWILLEKQRTKHRPLPLSNGFYLLVSVPRKGNVLLQRKQTEWWKSDGMTSGPSSLSQDVKRKCYSKFNLLLQNNFRHHSVYTVPSLVGLANNLTRAERSANRFFIKLPKIVHCTAVLHPSDLKRSIVPEHQVFACDGLRHERGWSAEG